MIEYPKINSVYLRDPATKHKTFLIGQYSEPEFAYLANCEWEFTEKVDGTNIRVLVSDSGIGFAGRTGNAVLPAPLLERLMERFEPQLPRLVEMFAKGACLYGEGYGARIQKGGGNYRPDQDFVLFDIRIGDAWLDRHAVQGIAAQLGLDVVPVIGCGGLTDMVTMATIGFESRWGSFPAEGIVARPIVPIRGRKGQRIITKVKLRDFQ